MAEEEASKKKEDSQEPESENTEAVEQEDATDSDEEQGSEVDSEVQAAIDEAVSAALAEQQDTFIELVKQLPVEAGGVVADAFTSAATSLFSLNPITPEDLRR